MPLSSPAEREPIHKRTFACQGFHRADGLWDIEGHLTDTKTHEFSSPGRGIVRPGEPIHDMWLRLTVDDNLLINAI
ncbi:MAG: DUF2889 domain-containing protein, partial [Alphaproteobacteria bacterium]